jgi:hypothetical protein
MALTADSVVVRLLEEAERLVFPLDSLERLDVYRGRARATGRGTFVGVATGLVIGLVIGLDSRAKCEERCVSMCERCGRDAVVGATLGPMRGAAVGAGVGALIKTNRWEEVPLDRIRVSFAQKRDGLALGLSVSF